MKLLFITYDFPFPMNSGGKTRAYNLLKNRSKNIEVTLFSFTRKGFDTSNIDGLKKIGITDIHTSQRKKLFSVSSFASIFDTHHSIFHKLYFDKKIEDQILEIIKSKKIDVVHFESFYTGFYISKQISELGVKQIFGTENIEADIYKDYVKYSVSPLFRPFYERECRKIRREEETMMEVADVSLSVTKSEKEHITGVSKKPCYVIENGVDLSKFTFEKRKNNILKTILFVGNFSYFPNSDAIDYFYHSIFKRLENPNLRLKIIGKGSTKLEFINDPRVMAEDYVSDIIEEYKNADLFVSPIRIGGGTNFKILESMANGLPVIAFPHRLHDLGVKDREHLLIASNEKEYVDSIAEFLDNKELVDEITSNARNLIEKNYSWVQIGERMNTVWNGIK